MNPQSPTPEKTNESKATEPAPYQPNYSYQGLSYNETVPKKHFMRWLLLVSGLVLLAVIIVILVVFDRQPTGISDRIKVVMVGNSFTSYNKMPSYLANVLSEDLYEITAYTTDGYSLYDHIKDTQEVVSFLRGVGDAPIDSNNWDVIILQDQSAVPGFGSSDPGWQESLEAIEFYADKANKVGARLIIVNTWAYKNGDPDNKDIYPDYSSMQTRLDSGFAEFENKVKTTYPQVRIESARVGRPWSKVPEAAGGPLSRDDLYDVDGRHPSIYGSALAAMVIAKQIDPNTTLEAFSDSNSANYEKLSYLFSLVE